MGVNSQGVTTVRVVYNRKVFATKMARAPDDSKSALTSARHELFQEEISSAVASTASLFAAVAAASIQALSLSPPFLAAPFCCAASQSFLLPPDASKSAFASALQEVIQDFFSASVADFTSLP